MVLLIVSSKFPECNISVNTLTISSSNSPESFKATAVVSRISSICRELRAFLVASTSFWFSCRCCCSCRNEVEKRSSSSPEVKSPFTTHIRKVSNCPKATVSLIPPRIIRSTSRRKDSFRMAKPKISLFISNPVCPIVSIHSTSHISRIAFFIISSKEPSPCFARRASFMQLIMGSRASGDCSVSLTVASMRPSSCRRRIKDTIWL